MVIVIKLTFSFTFFKILSPLQIISGGRVYGNYTTHTLTGRISIKEPNIQSVPRDFIILNENFSFRMAFIANKGKFNNYKYISSQNIYFCLLLYFSTDFVGNMLVSADFCQLELRLLAHFSRDQNLHSAFKKQNDIFISIAAQWNSIPEDEVCS